MDLHVPVLDALYPHLMLLRIVSDAYVWGALEACRLTMELRDERDIQAGC